MSLRFLLIHLSLAPSRNLLGENGWTGGRRGHSMCHFYDRHQQMMLIANGALGARLWDGLEARRGSLPFLIHHVVVVQGTVPLLALHEMTTENSAYLDDFLWRSDKS